MHHDASHRSLRGRGRLQVHAQAEGADVHDAVVQELAVHPQEVVPGVQVPDLAQKAVSSKAGQSLPGPREP